MLLQYAFAILLFVGFRWLTEDQRLTSPLSKRRRWHLYCVVVSSAALGVMVAGLVLLISTIVGIMKPATIDNFISRVFPLYWFYESLAAPAHGELFRVLLLLNLPGWPLLFIRRILTVTHPGLVDETVTRISSATSTEARTMSKKPKNYRNPISGFVSSRLDRLDTDRQRMVLDAETKKQQAETQRDMAGHAERLAAARANEELRKQRLENDSVERMGELEARLVDQKDYLGAVIIHNADNPEIAKELIKAEMANRAEREAGRLEERQRWLDEKERDHRKRQNQVEAERTIRLKTEIYREIKETDLSDLDKGDLKQDLEGLLGT